MKKNVLIVFVPIAAAAVLALLLGLSACEYSKGRETEKSLYTQGLEVVQLMSEMVKSEEYIDIYTGNDEIKSTIQTISTGDYTAPKAVYAITIPDESLAAMAELTSLDNASEALKSFLAKRTLSAVITQVNSLSGAENLAAVSICMGGKTFVNESTNENVIYLYTYEHAVPAAVTFTTGEDHAVSASGTFVIYDEFTCDSTDEIQAFFSDIIVDVTEVLPES